MSDAGSARQSGVNVELVREKTGFSHLAETDLSGLYVIVARRADESAGEKPRLRAANRTTPIFARFDPATHTRHRSTRVHFITGAPVERPAAFAATLERFLSE